MRLGVVDLLLTGFDRPLAPGGDHGHIGREMLDGQFKPHLIVALAGATVRDGVGALFERDIDQGLCDAGARVAGAEQIVLIFGARLEAGDDIVIDVVVGEIEHVAFGSAGLDRLFFQAFQLVGLTHVGRNGDDLAVVVVFL